VQTCKTGRGGGLEKGDEIKLEIQAGGRKRVNGQSIYQERGWEKMKERMKGFGRKREDVASFGRGGNHI